MSKIAAPCQLCLNGLDAVLSRPEAAQSRIEGWYFYRCPHQNCHVAITEDGDMHTTHCDSVEHGALINASVIASGGYHRRQIAQLIASKLEGTPKQ